MKKTVALLLALFLLLAVPACAEENYIRQLPQYTYYNETLLTWESYPEIRLTPNSTYNFFTNYNPVEPVFLCFPGPADALANEFDTDYVHFLDDYNAIQYSYQVKSSDSFEEFINKAAEDDYILLDGSDGMAAYIDPDGNRAYGMIATKEFGKSSKLVISITLDALSSKMPLDTRVTALTDAIVPEVQRVSAQMRYQTMQPYWNYNQYTGIKFLDEDDFEYMLKVTFPSLTLNYADGSQKTENLIVSRLRFGTLTGVYNYGDGTYMQVEISLDDNPYALYRMEEEKDVDAQAVNLANGKTWYIFMNGFTENGKASYCYASTPLGHMNHWDKEYYLTIHFDGTNISWSSVEDFMDDVALFDSSYEALSASDDPYEPTERPETVFTDDSTNKCTEGAADGTWVCPECGTESTGKFCPECGTAKPASAEWTCPNCGTVSEGKFCPECGTSRP